MGVEGPQESAPKVIRDPTHPEAGCGGIVPPVHTRFGPGNRANPGGRPKGADVVAHLLREMAKGARLDDDGNVIEFGPGAVEVANTWRDIATGKRDPSSVDSKALLALVDRASGAVVKETVNTNIEVLEDVQLRDRRLRPAPGTETKAPAPTTETKPNGPDGHPS